MANHRVVVHLSPRRVRPDVQRIVAISSASRVRDNGDDTISRAARSEGDDEAAMNCSPSSYGKRGSGEGLGWETVAATLAGEKDKREDAGCWRKNRNPIGALD